MPVVLGYAIISREGMIAREDGSLPDALKCPGDQRFSRAGHASRRTQHHTTTQRLRCAHRLGSPRSCNPKAVLGMMVKMRIQEGREGQFR